MDLVSFKRVAVVLTTEDTATIAGPETPAQAELKRKICNVVRRMAAACGQQIEVVTAGGAYAMTVDHQTGLVFIDSTKASR